MSDNRGVPAKLVGFGSIGRWMGNGYRLFLRSSGVSMGYAAIFVLMGLALEYWLLAAGYGLYYFILAGGFVLVSPFLFSPYYQGDVPVFISLPKCKS